MSRKYKRDTTTKDLIFVLLWVVLCIYSIRILAVCMKILFYYAFEKEQDFFLLREYTIVYISFGIACFAFSPFEKYTNNKIVTAMLFISLFISMVLLYYVQPYQLWDMLLGYKFVPITQP